jgi:uncharacterized repeat protein (TIGR01451 family)
VNNCNSQELFKINWERSFGMDGVQVANKIIQTSDGNYLVIGNSGSPNSNSNISFGMVDFWILKIDNNGNIIWENTFGGSDNDIPYSAKETQDGGFIIAGESSSNDGSLTTNNGNSDFWVIKIDSQGSLLWQKNYGGSNDDRASSLSVTTDGSIIVGGTTNSWDGDIVGNHGNNDYWVIKLNNLGDLIWQKPYGGTSTDELKELITTTEGNIVLTGYTSSNNGDVSGNNGESDVWVLKVDINGNIIWQSCYGGNSQEIALSLVETIDNNLILCGNTYSNNGLVSGNNGSGTSDAWVLKINQNGNLLWQKCFGNTTNQVAQSIEVTEDGGYIFSGYTDSGGGNISDYNGGVYDVWILRMDSLGNEIWENNLGGSGGEAAVSIIKTTEGEYLLTGFSNSNDGDVLSGQSGNINIWVVKFDEPNIIGRVYLDINSNCEKENNEIGVDGINLILNPGNRIVNTNNSGFWFVDSLETGNYSITVDTTNLNWNPTCPPIQSFTISNSNVSSPGPNFGINYTNPCPDVDISIYAPTLRRCFSNQKIYVSANNMNTATGILYSSFVDIELDPLLSLDFSSIPYVALGENVFRFQIGDLYPGQSENFYLSTTVSCNTFLNQTLCMDANLYPVESCVLDDTPSDPIINDGIGGTLSGFPQQCTLPWDQSSLSVDGWCQGDSIYFSITNTGQPGGGDMECYSPMWVTIDGVVTYTDSIMIPGGQTLILSYFGNGQTWILNAEQHPLHPGNSHPNAHVEACGDTTNWTPSRVNDFPQDDADPVVDIYCGVVTGSYDPNDKTGYPVGQTVNNYIQPSQQLQYLIRFQNTGTDTAFTVVIRDTLDTDLNIFTVTPGVSSHNYQFRMYGPRVLEWTFENILLPDSTTNQEASNGFVTFHVDQVPSLVPGTEITNDADIYFDFNDPITTNTTIHRIYEGFVEVLSIEDLETEGKSLLVYPNPTSNIITIKGKEGMNQSFSIFDQMGRIVFNGKLSGISTEVNLLNLSKGVYTLKIDGNFKPANVIKE